MTEKENITTPEEEKEVVAYQYKISRTNLGNYKIDPLPLEGEKEESLTIVAARNDILELSKTMEQQSVVMTAVNIAVRQILTTLISLGVIKSEDLQQE